MPTATARTFKSGNSEAVRLPKGIGFGVGTEVRLEREGDRVVLSAVHAKGAAQRDLQRLIDDLRALRGDVDLPREPRDADWWPERPGL